MSSGTACKQTAHCIIAAKKRVSIETAKPRRRNRTLLEAPGYAIFQTSMNQQTISNLATRSGRDAYQAYWHDLVVEQRGAVVPALWNLWRTASFGSELRLVSTGTVWRISHPLGPRQGMRVFMEEIVVRHYYNNVQALVYLGAVILLVFLGLRFSGLLSEEVALIGIGVEAFMLIMLFLVLFYAPEDAPPTSHLGEEEVAEATMQEVDDSSANREVIREVLEEIEEIGSSYASLGMKLEGLARAQEESIRELSRKVSAIQGLNLLESHAERLETTNSLLEQLVGSIESMNSRIDLLFGKEIEFHVRRQIEAMVERTATEIRRPANDQAEGTP